MSENRYGQQRKNYTNVNEPGPHYTSSTYKGSGRNRRRQSQRVRRRRKRRNLMLVLLTVVCFTSMVFALQLPQRIYSIYEMVTQASGSGENQDGDINGKGKLFGEAAGVGSGAGPNGDGGGENGTDHVGSGSDSTLAAGSDAAAASPVLIDGKNTEIGSHINPAGLYSPNAILVSLDSGEVLAGKNEDKKIYPASLTKIMTALVVLENTADWETSITMPADIYSELYAEDASMAGFESGETASIKALIYGIILPSGAECCEALARQVAGSRSAFVDMMNQKARELGMENTHFENTTGLHNDNHYTTVKDLAVLLQYALKNDYFREVFTAHRYSTQPSNVHPEGFTFQSTLFRYVDSSAVTGGEIIGGKTGYTGEAGLCLASLASVGGREYILVTTGANGNHETEQFHITDAFNLYNQILN